jgi:hypothetical protein
MRLSFDVVIEAGSTMDEQDADARHLHRFVPGKEPGEGRLLMLVRHRARRDRHRSSPS